MRNKNQRSLLTDSNSDLVRTDISHYYEMTLSNGSKRHCGTLRDVECILSMYPDAVYAKILLPHPPQTVDVPYVRVAPDFELPMQQNLPQNCQEPFIPNLHD
jgi:hypothetical protein